MLVLFALLACFDADQPAPVAVPALSFQEVACDDAPSGVELPEGAMVLSVMGCQPEGEGDYAGLCVSDMLYGYSVTLDSAPTVFASCVSRVDGASFVLVQYIEP